MLFKKIIEFIIHDIAIMSHLFKIFINFVLMIGVLVDEKIVYDCGVIEIDEVVSL